MTKTITILASADIHGCLLPWDYALSAATAPKGLAHLATIIKQQRQLDPELLLVDVGDSLGQGLVDERENDISPVTVAMNQLNYDAAVIGNHEFDHGLATVKRLRDNLNAPLLAANIYQADGSRWLQPYLIRKVAGVRIAFLALTHPDTPLWQAANPEHCAGLTFSEPMAEVAPLIKELQQQADIIIGLFHFGFNDFAHHSGCLSIAAANPGLAVIIGGHDHYAREQQVGDTLLIEPACEGISLAKISLIFDQENRLQACHTEQLLASDYPADEQLSQAFAAEHQRLLELAQEPVCQLSQTLPGKTEIAPYLPQVETASNALTHLLNEVQLQISGADISAASYFLHRADELHGNDLASGTLTQADCLNIYPHNSYIIKTKISGHNLRAYMEQHCAAYFTLSNNAPALSMQLPYYEYDMLLGLDYCIDLRQAQGSRITKLSFHGAPIAADDSFTLAINNYRYARLLHQGWIKPESRLWDSRSLGAKQGRLREQLVKYLKQQQLWQPKEYHNWRLIW